MNTVVTGKKTPVDDYNGAPRVADVLAALSYALDLTSEGQPVGHAARTCVLGMRIAREIGLDEGQRADLYYALLLKDAGCSSNASRMYQLMGSDEIQAKRNVKMTDWTRTGWETVQYALGHVRKGAPFIERVRGLFDMAKNSQQNALGMIQVRCERGAGIARRVGLSEDTAKAIYALDEHWNGRGYPDRLRGKTIPLLARILSLAQNLEVFVTKGSPAKAISMASERSGRWFDPDLVRAAIALHDRGELFHELNLSGEWVAALDPQRDRRLLGPQVLDDICLAFADIVDAKSPFTYRHSLGVAAAAETIGLRMGLSTEELKKLRQSALLHDVGKLSVSNAILEKPGKLSAAEWDIVKLHPAYSLEVLQRVPGFEHQAEIAASHHEKLDGSGYFRNMSAAQMPLLTRILVVADIFDALSAKRPYRDSLPLEQVFTIMRRETPHALDADCLQALIDATTMVPDLMKLDSITASCATSPSSLSLSPHSPPTSK
jgi:HD-GYP domain-containing protein (c-di-GMP phosphodiesterase class II)